MAVLYSQGETDYTQTVEWYATRFETVCQRFLDGDYGMAFPALLSSAPKRPGVESPIPPATAQIQVAESMDGVDMATTLPLYMRDWESGRAGDEIHYNQTTQDWIGEAFGRSASIVAGGTPVPETIVYGRGVELDSIEDPPAKVSCRGTSGTEYELDAEWTEVAEGDYLATLSGNPEGTVISEDLEIHAARK